MCLIHTVEDRNASIPLIFLVHCLPGSSVPCRCAVSTPKGSLGSGSATVLLSTVMLPLPVWLSSGATCYSAGAVLSFPLILSFHGQFLWHVTLQMVIRHLACGSSKFPQFPFQYLFSCNPPVGSKLFCIVRNNITFSISCLPVELHLHIMGYFCFLQT